MHKLLSCVWIFTKPAPPGVCKPQMTGGAGLSLKLPPASPPPLKAAAAPAPLYRHPHGIQLYPYFSRGLHRTGKWCPQFKPYLPTLRLGTGNITVAVL